MHYSRRTRVKLATPTEKKHGQQVDGQTDDSYKVRYIYIYEVYMSVCIYRNIALEDIINYGKRMVSVYRNGKVFVPLSLSDSRRGVP